MHEAQLHEHNSFITLTYDDQHLPENNSLDYRDFRLFMRRLRKFTKSQNLLSKKWVRNHQAKQELTTLLADMGARPHTPPRFYMCGEYGEKNDRPHFHACLFGHDFEDKVYYKKTPAGATIYTSEQLTQLWGKGIATTGALTFESAAYTARYVMKKITGPNASASYEKTDPETGEIKTKKPEFNNMSRKPGIAKNWLRLFHTDIQNGKIVVNGHEANAPRYYTNYLTALTREAIHYERHKEALLRSADNTDERLAVREQVHHAKTNQLKRNLA